MILKELINFIDDTTTIRLFETQENDTTFIFEGETIAIDLSLRDKEIKNISVFNNAIEIYLEY